MSDERHGEFTWVGLSTFNFQEATLFYQDLFLSDFEAVEGFCSTGVLKRMPTPRLDAISRGLPGDASAPFRSQPMRSRATRNSGESSLPFAMRSGRRTRWLNREER